MLRKLKQCFFSANFFSLFLDFYDFTSNTTNTAILFSVFFSFFNSWLFNFLLHVLYTHTVKMQQPLSTFQPNLMKKEMPSTKNATNHIYNFSFQTKKPAKSKTMENFNRRTEHTEHKSIFHSNVLIMFPARDSILFVPILCHALFYAFQFSAQCTQVVICVCSNSLGLFFLNFNENSTFPLFSFFNTSFCFSQQFQAEKNHFSLMM